MPARAPRLAVLGLLFVAAQEEEQPVRDGTTFMLMGKGDRCLATSLDDTAVELVSGCEARLASSGAGGWRVTWTSLLAPGSRLYLRNGEVLLHALDDESTYTPTGETDDEKEQRIERSARWRVRGSPSRDKSEVALESIYGTFLRRAGATVEQGRNYEDDAIWWKIVPVTERCSPPTLGERLASALSQYGWPMDAPPSSPACTQASASSGLEATLTSNADGRASKSSPSPPPLRPSQSEAARSNPTPAQAQESLTPSQTTPKAEATTNEPAGQPAASRVEPAKEADTWPIGRRRRGLAIPGFSIAQIRFSPISSSWVTHAVSALSLPSRLPALQMRLPQLPAVPIPSIALNSHGVYAITSWVVLLSTAVFSGSLELVEPRRIGTIYDDVLRMLRTTAVSQPFAKLLESTSTIVARVGNIVALLPRALHACARTLRLNNDIAALLAHGAITNAASDVLAQAIETEAVKGNTALVVLDWSRVARTTVAAVLSDDLPFLLWARLLWRLSRHYVVRLRSAPNLSPSAVRTLTHPAAVAAMKALLSQLVYETLSAISYLSMQVAMRGGGLQGILSEVRGKLWHVWRDGLAFFSATYMIVFALPRWWMQLVVDNIACLLFHTYMSHVSYRRIA